MLRKEINKKIEDWCKIGTSEGLPNVIQKDRVCSKIIWSLFIIISVSLCGYMISRSVNQYLQYEVTTKIRKEIKPNVPFPVISICKKVLFISL
jgi:hypothetical protein